MKRTIQTMIFAAGFALSSVTGSVAQTKMVSAAQIKPILTATKGQWLAVREFDGSDLLYFTHLLAWRCGLTTVLYSINGGPQRVWNLGTCDEEAANPNAIGDDQPIYIKMPLNSFQSVKVDIIYDDGSLDTVTYDRKSIQIN